MTVRLVIFGPPGAGKGTQAELLAGRLGIPTISTGELFRAEISRGGELGELAASYISQGNLVPDIVTIQMLRERLAQPDASGGFLLDGFPRNQAQIELLDDFLGPASVDAVIELIVGKEILVARLVNRGIERGRSDDTEAIIRNRLEVYRKQTAPVAKCYRERGLLHAIDGTGTVAEVAKRIESVVAAL